MTQSRIITVTLNPAVDIATDVAEVIADTKLRCGPPQFDPGGGGVNVARAVMKLGGRATALIAMAGVTGEMLAAMLRAEAVDAHAIEVSGQTRQSFTARETTTGKLYRFVTPGPPWTDQNSDSLSATLASVMKPDCFVVVSGSFPPGADEKLVHRLCAQARATGAHAIVDTSGPVLHALAHRAGAPPVHTLRMDMDEALTTSGRALKTPPDFAAYGAELVSTGVAEHVVIGMGPTGSVGVSADEQLMASRPVMAPISAVGAGDSFVGAMTLSLACGRSFADAVADGTAAAASAVMTAGTELCDAVQTDTFRAEVTRTVL